MVLCEARADLLPFGFPLDNITQQPGAMMEGPLLSYQKKLAAGELKPDAAQELLAEKLQSLHRSLIGYRPRTGQVGWREWLGFAAPRAAPLQGLYIYGGVGAGKSMLMDLFFSTAPVAKKRRVHFHEFLQDVHSRFTAFRKTKGEDEGDPIPAVWATGGRRVSGVSILDCTVERLDDVAGRVEVRLPGTEADHIDTPGLELLGLRADREGR